ncbi:MAG: HAMP domain-containing histidine kinase [Clostridiales bacterium]|nr:HAMP domain-containing histidine kinase [Clostridiales bacterium]MDR2751296.1 HAMP domain-containing histidine kinase [Clostridiales bacterium]
MRFNNRSLGTKLWIYFIAFSVAILILIWLLQTVFLNSFYQSMKTNSVKSVAELIAESYDKGEFSRTIDRLVYTNSLLAYVTDASGNLMYASDEHGPGDNGFGKPGLKGSNARRQLPLDYSDFLSRLAESENGTVSYIVEEFNTSNKSLIYGRPLGDYVLYISTPIEPLEATIKILQKQLFYISIIIVLGASVIAFVIAKKLSNPLAQLTKAAEELAGGNYKTKFERSGYAEVDELSQTLSFAASELSKVESLRRELIANISHDFRTPLTMIKGYTEMIEEVSGDDKQKREKHLSVIKEEVSRLSSLVTEILDLSVLQSGNEALKVQDVNLSEIVKNVLARFAVLSEQDGFKFESEIAFDQYALADKTRIEQVLYNLIGNAVNHSKDIKTVTVRLLDLGGSVRVEVRDKGQGIAQEEIPYIWDRYYKSKKRSRNKVGNGIGLSIVKSVLELHHAKYGVDSEVGKGSSFWFELKK